eukprot:4506491-Pleurochrysis_carterae.AAC.2
MSWETDRARAGGGRARQGGPRQARNGYAGVGAASGSARTAESSTLASIGNAQKTIKNAQEPTENSPESIRNCSIVEKKCPSGALLRLNWTAPCRRRWIQREPKDGIHTRQKERRVQARRAARSSRDQASVRECPRRVRMQTAHAPRLLEAPCVRAHRGRFSAELAACARV